MWQKGVKERENGESRKGKQLKHEEQLKRVALAFCGALPSADYEKWTIEKEGKANSEGSRGACSHPSAASFEYRPVTQNVG